MVLKGVSMNKFNQPLTINHQPLTILVTGGAGYIGSITVKKLIDEGFKIVVLDSLENGHKEAVNAKAILEICNLSDVSAVTKVFDKHKIDAVIDFAAYLSVGESMDDPKKYMRNNCVNFVKLLDVMKKKNCKYIIKSSTASTYGNPENESDFPLKENYQDNFKPDVSTLLPGTWDNKKVKGEDFFQKVMNYYDEIFSDHQELALSPDEIIKLRIPASIYGLTKLIDEIILDKYNKLSGINYTALRYFNVCGADIEGDLGEDKPTPTTLMTLIVSSLLGKTGPLKIFGTDYPTKDGTGIRDYIHPKDLATGHISALNHLFDTNKSDIFNLGAGKGYSVLEVISAMESASGKKVETEVAPRRSGDPAVSYADPQKAEEILKWKTKYNLSDMAKTAWTWHEKHPEGYESVSG